MKKIIFWILNLLTFGYFKKKVGKKINEINNKKNLTLILDTIEKPNLEQFFLIFGGKNNIEHVSATISTLSITIKNILLVDLKKIGSLSKKGFSQNGNNFILLLGDCSQTFASDIKKELKN